MIGFKNNSAVSGNGNDDTSDLILEQGIVSNIANIYKYSGGYKWQINNEIYQTTTDKTRTIVAAAVGFYRIDIAVLDTNNDIVLIQGVENASAAKMPNVPNDTILLNSWVIFGNTINPPSSTVKSINQDNIPLRYDILSTQLPINDVFGFLYYFKNTLPYTIQVKETNSLVQFICTDTGDVYQFTGVGKGIYGPGAMQLTPNNVLKYSDVAKSNSYSTTETKTGGTWIDGKPIYRKVFEYQLSVDGVYVPHGVSDLGQIVECKIIARLGTTTYSLESNNNVLGDGFVNPTDIYVENIGGVQFYLTIIIEYTKTTD